MIRRHDWPERLIAVIEASAARAFAPGVHDCGTFAADCIEAVTGQDVAADWRGAYDDQAAGLALAGVRSVVALPEKVGLTPVPTALARRGDIAIAAVGPVIDGVPALALAVFDGAWLVGPCGVRVPRDLARRAWSVG